MLTERRTLNYVNRLRSLVVALLSYMLPRFRSPSLSISLSQPLSRCFCVLIRCSFTDTVSCERNGGARGSQRTQRGSDSGTIFHFVNAKINNDGRERRNVCLIEKSAK